MIMILIVLTFLLATALLAGQWSGNQPRRDAFAAAKTQLGIALESRLVPLGDITLHVVLAGPADGKPVILLHGYPEFWYAWRGPMAALAMAGFRVIVPDQRGYNASSKPGAVGDYRLDRLAADVVALADALGYEKFNLAGHDFGGLVSWWILLLHSDRVEKAVIVNKPHPYANRGFSSGQEAISWYRTFLRLPWVPGYLGRLGNWRLLVKNLRATSMPDTFPEAVIDQFRSAWDQDGAIHSMGAWYRANAEFDMSCGDGKIAVPTLVLLAANDAFSPADLARRSIQFLENGDVRELGMGTHWIIQEAPEVVGKALIEFFSES